jgi:hypothetical protein
MALALQAQQAIQSQLLPQILNLIQRRALILGLPPLMSLQFLLLLLAVVVMVEVRVDVQPPVEVVEL